MVNNQMNWGLRKCSQFRHLKTHLTCRTVYFVSFGKLFVVPLRYKMQILIWTDTLTTAGKPHPTKGKKPQIITLFPINSKLGTEEVFIK